MLTLLYVPPSLLVLAARGALAQSSSGMTYVDVGPVENPFTFSPSSVQLLPDSLGVTFQFSFARNHSIKQSYFEEPCTWAGPGTYDGGDYTVVQSELVGFAIDPKIDVVPALYFFDDADDRCQRGMVFPINPPSDKDSEDFKSRAMASSSSSTTGSATSSASSTSFLTRSSSPSSPPSAKGNKTSDNGKDENDKDGVVSIIFRVTAGVLGAMGVIGALAV
ncbi:unnamed protein product [Somion occarium]|uniref:Uncharacterized protein n=1 Tax=Somion occarium TaxID=3059160 RepID=A0ABP1CQS5_9APHY